MKVTCESCGSKYTIKDEKVRGKRVKIRCKGCKNPIVVDGTALDRGGAAVAAAPSEAPEPQANAPAMSQQPATSAAPAAAEQPIAADSQHAPAPVVASAAAADERWSVNLSETDSRDMTTDEIVAAWASGEVTDDAYIYKPGFDDWKPILEVPELAARLGSPSAAGSAPDAFAAPAGESPYAASAGTARAAAGNRSGDLFGGLSTAGSEEDAAMFQPTAVPGATGRPTGARNESSVLFSLDALKAGFEPQAPAAAAPTNNDDPFGLGASSGLAGLGGGFDQNQALLTAPPPEPKKPKKMVSAAPGAEQPAGLDRSKIIMIAAGVLALVVAVGGVGFALGGRSSDDEKETAKTEKVDDNQGGKVRKGNAAQDQKADESEDAKKDKGDSNDDKSEADSSDEKKEAADDKEAGDEAKPDKEEDSSKQASEHAAGKSTSSGTKDDSKSSSKSTPKAAPKQAPAESAAAPFNKSAAISSLSSAAASAASCKIPGGPTGGGKVIVTFAPSGRVTTANVVGGKFGGSSVGGCVASRFRRARVPAFSGGPVTVSKSFNIQ